MDSQIVAIYHNEDQQCQMSDAEVMTVAIIAMLCRRGNLETSRRFLYEQDYIPRILSKKTF